jgi:hypothetical protein
MLLAHVMCTLALVISLAIGSPVMRYNDQRDNKGVQNLDISRFVKACNSLDPWLLGSLGSLDPWAPWILGLLGSLGSLDPWAPYIPGLLGSLGSLGFLFFWAH